MIVAAAEIATANHNHTLITPYPRGDFNYIVSGSEGSLGDNSLLDRNVQ